MQELTFRKFSGAGNTFVILEAADAALVPLGRVELARRLCEKTRGVAVDGVLYLDPGRDGADYVWDFYNADGSSAEMCGNAARCAGRFVHEVHRKSAGNEIVFLTKAGKVGVRRADDGSYVAEMTPVRVVQNEIRLTTDDGVFEGLWIDTGVPHFVISVSDLARIPAAVCRSLRRHADLGAAGANVTLLKAIDGSRAEAVTYERGVEDFTAACGTGAVAAAWKLTGGHSGSSRIRMPGGELEVTFGGGRPLLRGSALFLGEYKPHPEFFA